MKVGFIKINLARISTEKADTNIWIITKEKYLIKAILALLLLLNTLFRLRRKLNVEEIIRAKIVAKIIFNQR